MNLILLHRDELDGHRICFDDRRAQHLHRVLRVEPGASVRVGVIGGCAGIARVVAISEASTPLKVELKLDEDFAIDELAPRPSIDLIVALPRPKALRRLLRAVSSFGVGRVHLVNAWRVDKSYWQSEKLAPDNLRQMLIEGCEQGRQTWLPVIETHRLLMPFLGGLGGEERRVICDPSAEVHLEDAIEDSTRIVAALGPEGGWIDSEISAFSAADFRPARLLDAVLSSEVAAAALLGQLSLIRRLGGRRALS